MSMNATEIKTRHGLILQGVTAIALTQAGFTYRENWQYDDNAEVPDFLMPDDDNPNIVIEVHQTDARDSFRMKTLRAFTAVMESKVHFGDDIVSVNVLFGDPDTEIPSANFNALCGFFDVNIVPRNDADDSDLIVSLEECALKYASDEDFTVQEGIRDVVQESPDAVEELGLTLQSALNGAGIKENLAGLWQMERERCAALGDAPLPGDPTYYKRALLKALFLSDDQFDELVAKQDPNLCSEETQKQLLSTKLAKAEEMIDGDSLILEKTLRAFIEEPDGVELRELCREALDQEVSMRYFFDDIRDFERRISMARIVKEVLGKGKEGFYSSFDECFTNGTYEGVEHTRCWVGDIVPLLIGKSHNFFNGIIYRDKDYKSTLANPYPNIVIRSPRLGKNNEVLKNYSQVCSKVLFEHVKGLDLDSLKEDDVAEKIINFRIAAAIKLKKLDPLFLTIKSICDELDISFEEIKTRNCISDLANEGATGVYQLYVISKGDKEVLMNFVAVHDQNGDHKSKEWGARRRAILYRIQDGDVVPSEYQDALFVLDGEWEPKHVRRLYHSGWNRIVRLSGLKDTLRKMFNI